MTTPAQESYAAYGVRLGDVVLWKSPGGVDGRVTAVDYSSHLAHIDWGNYGEWCSIDELFVQMCPAGNVRAHDVVEG